MQERKQDSVPCQSVSHMYVWLHTFCLYDISSYIYTTSDLWGLHRIYCLKGVSFFNNLSCVDSLSPSHTNLRLHYQ